MMHPDRTLIGPMKTGISSYRARHFVGAFWGARALRMVALFSGLGHLEGLFCACTCSLDQSECSDETLNFCLAKGRSRPNFPASHCGSGMAVRWRYSCQNTNLGLVGPTESQGKGQSWPSSSLFLVSASVLEFPIYLTLFWERFQDANPTVCLLCPN
jgi:hypothetical protein